VQQPDVQVGADLLGVAAGEVAAMVNVQDVGEAVQRPPRVGFAPDRLAQGERKVQR
jgi:hypothetical protein